MKKTRILLIEDEAEHCQEYIDFNIEQGRPYVLKAVHGCDGAMALLESFQPDIILLDLMLNGGDGSGFEFLRRSRKFNLLKKPHIIVITWILSKQTHNKALEFGADFIIIKDKVDYSPKFAFDHISNFVDVGYSGAKAKYNSEERIKEVVAEMIEKIGITHDMDGRAYIIDAIYLSFKLNTKNLNQDIYPALAKKYGKSKQNIQKAIHNAINKAWKSTDLAILKKYYTAQTSYVSGAPSNKEFICYFVDKIKA